ncbi:MAG: hypothetical protein KAJ19_29315, partial [Gammaproteobacteria bacterium]|nr:hypothetical protein [Gammaproteobacteria bacterium]
EGITTNGGAITVFKYVGHFNGQGINDVNNFAYDTPAVFISFDLIEWIHTKHDTPEVDVSRAQSGRIRFSLHYFFHDLRTDTDSFTDHLQTIDYVYHSILGLRSDSSVLGKISSMRRVSEVDDNDNNNLREWISTYETAVEETGITPGRIDAAPVVVELTVDLPPKP